MRSYLSTNLQLHRRIWPLTLAQVVFVCAYRFQHIGH